MPEGMNEFLWFALGIFSYRIISGILHYGHLALLLEEQLYHIIKLLDILSKDLDNAYKMKYSVMKDSGLSVDEIQRIKESDDKSYKIWREMSIVRIITHWPKVYKKIIRFNNWREAIKYVRDSKKIVAK